MANTSQVMTFNSGAEDVLLFSNDHSFFQHTGYTRTSNFAQTYLDTPCKGGTCQLGTTATFELTKEGDLLGATDLMIRVMPPENLEFNGANGEKWGVAWVENLGYAMLERITLTIGNGGEVEVLSGEILNIQNEMFKDSGNRLHNHILKTSVTPFPTTLEPPAINANPGTDVTVKNHIPGIRNNGGVGLDEQKRHSRLIGTCMKDDSGNKSCKIYQTEPLNLVIPLGFFFTKRPDVYLPLGPIASASQVRVNIKFRPIRDLLQYYPMNTDAFKMTGISDTLNPQVEATWLNAHYIDPDSCIRQHVIGVTAAENAALTTSEHVRLLTVWGNPTTQRVSVNMNEMKPYTINNNDANSQYNPGGSTEGVIFKPSSTTKTPIKIPCNFLHPVKEIVFTIRKLSEIEPSQGGGKLLAKTGAGGAGDFELGTNLIGRNYFAYHGGNLDSNLDSVGNSVMNLGATYVDNVSDATAPVEKWVIGRTAAATTLPARIQQSWCEMDKMILRLNSHDVHSSIDGINREFLQERLMPAIHSGTSTVFTRAAMRHTTTTQSGETMHDLKMLAGDQDRKDIFVFPIGLAPESNYPSGSINFSKVSTGELQFELTGFHNVDGAGTLKEDYQIDMYPLYYNWAQIKDGRVFQSFV